MATGRFVCEPLTVQEVIDDPNLNHKHVAVHGLFYLGAGCAEGEYLILPRSGPFDGVGPIPLPNSINREECLFVEQSDVGSKVGSSGAAGLYFWKNDCVIVGQIRHRPGTDHPYRIGDLWLMMLQDWLDQGKGQPFHQMRLVFFSYPTSSELPWDGPITKRHGDPVIQIKS